MSAAPMNPAFMSRAEQKTTAVQAPENSAISEAQWKMVSFQVLMQQMVKFAFRGAHDLILPLY